METIMLQFPIQSKTQINIYVQNDMIYKTCKLQFTSQLQQKKCVIHYEHLK